MNSTSPLKAARNALDWSQEKLARAINARAAAHGLPERSVPSRKTDISRWENGHVVPEPPMRAVLREIYGRTDDDLGFPTGDFAGPSGDELAERLVIARRVDEQTIELFRDEVISVRHADRRFGSAARLERLRGQITEIEGLLRHTILRRDRAPLAGVLVEASTLAGWNSLDIGSLAQAWTHYERAKYAAMESGSTGLLAHATAEQAFVLIDTGNVDDALALFGEARSIGEHAPELLRAWLAAAEGEGHAIAGHRDEALRAFDEADTLLPNEVVHPELPFVFLGGSHLDRWRGNALVHLGAPEAIEHLERVVDDSRSTSFVRAGAAVYVDLAFAYSASGDREAARTYAQQARRIISQVGSVRLRRRLERLVLPGDSDPA
ncbi:tetratricopeptide repeat protein [Amycolatopsis roodepoortensis]|uniref:Tetratricopeptide (TPR) repeat protein n=1 Tax=Amycolatopsis roodepoortensis TaxID=700274 RepID=A0ABR9LBE4_9PSEU|nr:tetratricopeptide repeat protein [Amycolatopsis roodepoortensis]MBE1577647.1 tetratricopeptide (TPR) repeat protein [Amycolatopsis roodepoortensis]